MAVAFRYKTFSGYYWLIGCVRDGFIGQVSGVADAKDGEYTCVEVREGVDESCLTEEQGSECYSIDSRQDEGKVEKLDFAKVKLCGIAHFLTGEQVGQASIRGGVVHDDFSLFIDGIR